MVNVAQWLGYQIVTLVVVSSSLTVHPILCARSSMAEHRIVNPGVRGSTPLGHAWLFL